MMPDKRLGKDKRSREEGVVDCRISWWNGKRVVGTKRQGSRSSSCEGTMDTLYYTHIHLAKKRKHWTIRSRCQGTEEKEEKGYNVYGRPVSSFCNFRYVW